MDRYTYLTAERVGVMVALLGATVLSWLWIVPMSRDMYGPMSGASAWMMTPVWDARHLALLFAMWAVMMTGMMLPSATPTILLYMGVSRSSEPGSAVARTYAFAAGYLAIWSMFSVAAVAIQRALASTLILSPMMQFSDRRAASVVLALAGLYQLTPYKRTCLSACQSPATFVAKHWRAGAAGAFRMGVTHGLFCLGCCWALMLLLFVGGVMHLTTILLLTVFVLLEKVLPLSSHVRWFTWATGTAMLMMAVALI